jgi:hypothetical protein
MQFIGNLVEKLVRIYHIILIIDQKRKQKAQKRSFLSPELSEPNNQKPNNSRGKNYECHPQR